MPAVPGTTGTQGIPGFPASLPSTGDRLTRRNYAPHFENLTPVYPSERLRLEAGDASPTARHLMMVLVGERPEEVTDLRRSVRGEVVYSTFDQSPDDHVWAAELAVERAKRLAEVGQDVVILLDSLTRLGRAYNLAGPRQQPHADRRCRGLGTAAVPTASRSGRGQ
jgi:transcription termination factor Rho